MSNASPLIYLAKVGKLSLLKELFQTIHIPEEVYYEVCEGQPSPDAIVVSDAVKEGWIENMGQVSGDMQGLATGAGIDGGEAAAILLAREKRSLLLIDDKMGRTAAEILGISCLGTIGVLLQALSNSHIKHYEFIEILDRLIDAGFRLDSKVYRVVLKVAKEIVNES